MIAPSVAKKQGRKPILFHDGSMWTKKQTKTSQKNNFSVAIDCAVACELVGILLLCRLRNSSYINNTSLYRDHGIMFLRNTNPKRKGRE